jgi:hypothetical protein
MPDVRRVARIHIGVDAQWRPPFALDLGAGFRRVDEDEALAHARPHLLIAEGGPHDGYTEWWVADIDCGCDHDLPTR